MILWYITLRNPYTYIEPKECIEDHCWFSFSNSSSCLLTFSPSFYLPWDSESSRRSDLCV